jgi:hypothetical protein
MKEQFEMTDDELKEMHAIATQPVMYLSGGTPMYDIQGDANRFWQKLGDKYGFIWDSAEGAGTGNHKQFMAYKTTQP